MKIILFFALSGASLAQAAVVPCQEPDGQVVYREAPCGAPLRAPGVAPRAPNVVTVPDRPTAKPTNPNDLSGMRGLMIGIPQSALNGEPHGGTSVPECQFKYFASGDSKGRSLADNAKHECLENLDRKRAGQPVTLEAYNMWRDHFNSERAHRNTVVDRMQRR